MLKLYPDVAALGSPFGTGNETFGLSSQFKRASAIVGDTAFQSQRRSLAELLGENGVPIFAYFFTDPQPSQPAFLGGEQSLSESAHGMEKSELTCSVHTVPHASEVPYVFGDPPNGPPSVSLSKTMIDYWLSFANSLTPNDGKGNVSRTSRLHSTRMLDAHLPHLACRYDLGTIYFHLQGIISSASRCIIILIILCRTLCSSTTRTSP